MNARIASLLKDRISELVYVDKLAGLVRAVTYQRAGESITIPVDIGVNDPLACGDAEISELVPNEGYACIVYFEDKGIRRVQSRTRGIEFESRMRLVCWINTAKFNGDNTAGDRIMQQFLGVLQVSSHNSGPFVGVRHSVESMPERGKTLFGAYTYPDSSRQYLMWPFDAFGIDVVTTFRIKPGCEDEVTQGDDECWTPPANRRRRNPAEFSCDELNAPVTGLMDTQKDCIEGCGGSGPCDPVIIQLRDTSGINIGAPDVYPAGASTTKTAPDGSVQLRDSIGSNIGTPVPVRSNQHGVIVTAPDGTVEVHNSANTLIGIGTAPSGGNDVVLIADVTHTQSDGAPAILPAGIALVCAQPANGRAMTTDGITPVIVVPPGTDVPLQQTSIRYKDVADVDQELAPTNTLFGEGVLKATTRIARFIARTTDGLTSVVFGSAASPTVNLPQSVIKYRDAANAPQVTAPSNTEFSSIALMGATEIPRRQILNGAGNPANATFATALDLINNTLPTAADAAVAVNSAAFGNALSNGSLDVPVKNTAGIAVGSKVGIEWIVPAALHDTISFEYAAFTNGVLLTVRAANAGTYIATTNDGGSGTITFSKNGGAFAAFTNPTALSIGDTIEVRRTTIGANGWVEMTQ